MAVIGVTGAGAQLIGVRAPSVEIRGSLVRMVDCDIDEVKISGSRWGVSIVNCRGTSISWVGSGTMDLDDVSIVGGQWVAISLEAHDSGTVRRPMIDTVLHDPTGGASPTAMGLVLGQATDGLCRVKVSNHAGPLALLKDCTDTVLDGSFSATVTEGDIVSVWGGERVTVRGDIHGSGDSAVNIISGSRHRVYADLGAASSWATSPVIDGGTGTIDQSIVD